MAITVLYTCDKCNTVDRKVTVRTRYENELVTKWMEEVQRRLAIDHGIHSPSCKITAFTNAKIPFVNEKGLGF